MELIFMHYLLLGVLWATMTFQLFLDANGDGQHQAEEPGLAGLEYTLTRLDGNTSSVRVDTTLADGYLTTSGQGQLTIESATCAPYTAQVGEVAGQSVIELPCAPQHTYLPLVKEGGF